MLDGESSSSSDESLESDSTCSTSISEESSTKNGHESSSSSSEVSFEGQSNESDLKSLNDEIIGDDHDVYASSVREWTQRVPIGMNLCPWAKLSHKEGRIKYITCPVGVQTPKEASEVVWREIENLLGSSTTSDERNHSLPPLSTTLVICPHVTEWENDYTAFEGFVKKFGREESSSYGLSKHQSNYPRHSSNAITLVAFHPAFLRWRGLPESISIGCTIRCHKGLAGFSKSPVAHTAIVVDLLPKGFGRRRIRVRFDDEGSTSIEQCIPVEWVVLPESEERPPLSDNLMHRAPYPTIHILRNKDLQNLTIHDISRLKRRNAKRMLSEELD